MVCRLAYAHALAVRLRMTKAGKALSGSPSQSGVGHKSYANRAVDGNVKTCTHTNTILNTEEGEWWKLDLRQTQKIARVEVWRKSIAMLPKTRHLHLFACADHAYHRRRLDNLPQRSSGVC